MPLPKPPPKAILYEDKQVYAALASYPLTKGHTIIAWKKAVKDIHELSCAEYEHLMHVVDIVRDALLKELKVKKVYLLYMDEAKHVHWHLVPRYNEQGMNVLAHSPKKAAVFPLASPLSKRISQMTLIHKKDL